MTTVSLTTDLGWVWLSRRGQTTQHLFPARPGSLSRSACGRLPAAVEDLEEVLMGLIEEPPAKCRSCLEKA